MERLRWPMAVANSTLEAPWPAAKVARWGRFRSFMGGCISEELPLFANELGSDVHKRIGAKTVSLQQLYLAWVSFREMPQASPRRGEGVYRRRSQPHTQAKSLACSSLNFLRKLRLDGLFLVASRETGSVAGFPHFNPTRKPNRWLAQV